MAWVTAGLKACPSCRLSLSAAGEAQVHGLRIPVDNTALSVAEVAEQRSSCRTETKDCIFHRGLARTDRGKEIPEMIVAVAVSNPCNVFLVTELWRSHRVLSR